MKRRKVSSSIIKSKEEVEDPIHDISLNNEATTLNEYGGFCLPSSHYKITRIDPTIEGFCEKEFYEAFIRHRKPVILTSTLSDIEPNSCKISRLH